MILGRRVRKFQRAISEKVCIYFPYVQLSRQMKSTRVISHGKRSLSVIALGIFALSILPSLSVSAQEALVAVANTVEPTPLVAPEQSIDLSAEINPPLPVAATDSANDNSSAR